MSEQWYRNRIWNAEIEKAFEARILRGRAQKAQHLMIQGHALIEHHPDIAVRMLQRSIALEDDFHLNQAYCYLATAQLALGRVDEALEAYEAALEAQLRLPFIQTSAPLDYAFTVAWFGRSERFPVALPILEAVQPSVLPGANFQADVAHALILADTGEVERAAEKARFALTDFPLDEGQEAEWGGISFTALRTRLAEIADG